MKLSKAVVVLVVLWLMALGGVPLDAKEPKRPVTGPLITIYAPHAQQFEIGMDEVELDWSHVPGAKSRALGRQASPAGGARIVEGEGVRARAIFAPVASTAELEGMAAALRLANPGANAHLVLYEPGRPKNAATRRLLTHEVGLLMEPGVDPQPAIAGLPVVAMRPLVNVADGYVLHANNAIAALNLADALRHRSGVRNAYPLVRRQYVPR